MDGISLGAQIDSVPAAHETEFSPCGQLPRGSLEYESGDEANTSSGADRVETLGRAGARGPRGAQPLQIGRSVSADMCGI